MKPNEGIAAWLVLLLAIMAGISVANLYYCQPLLNIIREDMGLSEFQVNLMPVFTQIGYALGLLFIIPMGDLYNRRSTICICFSVLVVALLATAFAPSPQTCGGSWGLWVLLGGAFTTGIFSVAPQVFIPFVSQFSKPSEKERKVGYILSGLLIGILGSRVVSGYVGHLWGWRTMYITAAVLIAISARVLYCTFPSVEPTFNGRFRSLMASIGSLVRKYPQSLTYAGRAALTFGSLLGMWACLAFRMKEAPFYQDSNVVGLLGICGIMGALTASNVGRFIPRYGVERINTLGALLVVAAWVILALAHDSYAGIILGIIIIDIGMQCVQLSNQSATMKLCTEASSRMNTIFMVTYFIGGSFGTFLAGTLWSLFGWNGTVAAGLSLIFLAMLFSRFKNRKQD